MQCGSFQQHFPASCCCGVRDSAAGSRGMLLGVGMVAEGGAHLEAMLRQGESCPDHAGKSVQLRVPSTDCHLHSGKRSAARTLWSCSKLTWVSEEVASKHDKSSISWV